MTDPITKRVRRAGYSQSKGCRCIICGGDWDTCKHSLMEVDAIIDVVKQHDLIGKYGLKL